MKKLKIVMSMIAAASTLFGIPVFANDFDTNVDESIVQEQQDPRASLYFSSYGYDLKEYKNQKGKLAFMTSVVVSAATDKIRISVQIQEYTDENGWEDYGGEYIATSSKKAYVFEDVVNVESGKEYRAKFFYEAIVGGKVVETRSGVTSSVTAP